ncbi:MAG: AAA family ATPase [Deltaproteobacteria bacterium]|nr:AAA family ATPase [Deltaproteobacteria bacterium]
MKELPIGVKSFADIIDNKLVYADKTKYIYDLVTDVGKINFS